MHIQPEAKFTLHFLFFESNSQNPVGAFLEIRDGVDKTARLLLKAPIINGTRPQGVESSANKIWIRFVANPGVTARFVIRISVTRNARDADILIKESVFASNGVDGVRIENIRSQAVIERSQVLNSGRNGITVIDGAGDVNLTHVTISESGMDGLNISYAGGMRNVTQCSFLRNRGAAISVYLNETTTSFYPIYQRTDIQDSVLDSNFGGIRHGNFCHAPLLGE